MTRSLRYLLATSLLASICAMPATAQVIDYDAGVITIDGVQIFQDADDPERYYYLPRYPKVAVNEAGDFEMLLLKTVDAGEGELGGIFHTLIEFALPDDVRDSIEEELMEMRPDAELAGALPLLEPTDEEADRYGSFRVVSATLTENGEISSRVLTSGPAPLRAGSKAAVAARLSSEEATILMDSLTGSTADISVSVRGFYEAKVRGYNAEVKANMETVYSHRSVVDSYQKKYTKRQLRNIVDELVQDGAIEIDVYDRSESLNIAADDLESVLSIVTDKLTEIMFDTETGWSQEPEPEEAVAQDQIKGRLEQGWFQKTFMNAQDQPYYTDDQYVMKRREDIRSNSFYLNLSQSTTIRIPIDSSGNLGGFYGALEEEERAKYFRTVVPGEDTDVQSRDVIFQVDGEVAEGFGNNFNSVVVNIRKRGDQGEDDFTKALQFTPDTIAEGNGLQSIRLYREGDPGSDWTEFEYQTAWNLRGGTNAIREPSGDDDWVSTSDSAVALTPPLERADIQIDVDTSDFEELGIAAAEVQVASTVLGEVKYVSDELVRASEASPTRSVVAYHDPGEDVAYRVIWHTRLGRIAGDFKLLDGSFAFIFPPSLDWLEERLQ